MSRADGPPFLNNKTREAVESIFDKEMAKHTSAENIREILARLKSEILQI
jgi:hypothetical protein